MTGQGDKCGARKGWDAKLIHSLKAKVHAMAGTCEMDGRLPTAFNRIFDMVNWQQGRDQQLRPQLRFKDVCKQDLQALGINTDS